MSFPGHIIGAVAGTADIPLVLVAPFALLLLLIAVMPLAGSGVKHWWEKYYPAVSASFAALMALYYIGSVPAGGGAVAHMLRQYCSFIAMIGSLYVVAGGIHIQVKGQATPMANRMRRLPKPSNCHVSACVSISRSTFFGNPWKLR